MKDTICLIAGVIGGFIATLLGGWDSALVTLVVFMGIDFVTGIVTAAMGKSKHSESGTLNSTAGWVGLAKKFCILLMVVVGVRIDILIGTNYIRDAVCIIDLIYHPLHLRVEIIFADLLHNGKIYGLLFGRV